MNSDTSAKAARVMELRNRIAETQGIHIPVFEVQAVLDALSIAPDAEPVAIKQWRYERTQPWYDGEPNQGQFDIYPIERRTVYLAAPLPAKDAVGEARRHRDALQAIVIKGAACQSAELVKIAYNALAASSPPKDAQP